MLHYLNYARGIAVLMVVLVHHTNATQDSLELPNVLEAVGMYGRMGVQLFFVASSITLCMSAARKGVGLEQVPDFFLRRFLRIGPVYYLAILIYFLAYQVGASSTGPYDASAVFANIFFLNGFHPDAQSSIVPGGWSISAEVIFYALFPLLFFIYSELHKRYYALGVYVITIAAIVFHLLLWWLVPHFTQYQLRLSNVFYYWPPSQIPVFLIGMASFFILQGKMEKGSLPLSLVGLLMLTSINFWLWDSEFLLAHVIIPIFSAISFTFLLVILARLIKRDGFIQKIGIASYSMYLIHFLFVWLLSERISNQVMDTLGSPVASFAISYILITCFTFILADRVGRPIELKSSRIKFGTNLRTKASRKL